MKRPQPYLTFNYSRQLVLASFRRRNSWGQSKWDCWSFQSRPAHAIPIGAHVLSAPVTFAVRKCKAGWKMQSRVDSEPVDRTSHIASPSLAKSRGKWRRKAGQPPERALKHWPQRTECEADGTQTLIQVSHCPVRLFWHFIWTYLFSPLKIYLHSWMEN